VNPWPGPNAVVYTLEKDIVEVTRKLALAFPPKAGVPFSEHISDPALAAKVNIGFLSLFSWHFALHLPVYILVFGLISNPPCIYPQDPRTIICFDPRTIICFDPRTNNFFDPKT